MNLLVLTKFPPTQGGEAAKSYWIARGLAERGHTVHVVTNSNETDRAFLIEDAVDPAAHLPPGVRVHFIDPEVEFHVPFHLAFAERLASKALEIVQEESIDVVEAAHLTPFGVSALVVKACTGVPLVQRHGGSDVGYLWKSRGFGTLLTKVVQAADRVAVNGGIVDEFLRAGIPRERLSPFRYYIDLESFRPDGERHSLVPPSEGPVLLFSGKITPGKRLIPLLEALRDVEEPFTLLLLPVAFKTEMVEELVELYGLGNVTTVIDPRPPWEMPSLLRSVDAVCCLETRFTTVNHWPLFPREVLASGACLLLSREQYRRGALGEARDGEHLVMADPDDPTYLRATMRRVIADAALRAEVACKGSELVRSESYDAMLDDMESVYASAIEYAHALA